MPKTIGAARERPLNAAGSPAARVGAAAAAAFVGVGFGVPGVLGMRHFERTGEPWTFMGFPTYGGGPFERIGLATSTPLLAGFVATCAAEVGLAAYVLARGRHAQAASLALLPLELAYWIGFALPVGPPLGLARVALLWFDRHRRGAVPPVG